MDGKIADRKGYEYMRKLVSSTPKTGATNVGGESKGGYPADDMDPSMISKKKNVAEAKVDFHLSDHFIS